MWTKYETEFIGKLYSDLDDETLEDLLPSDLIKIVKAEGGLAYQNLRYSFLRCSSNEQNFSFSPENSFLS